MTRKVLNCQVRKHDEWWHGTPVDSLIICAVIKGIVKSKILVLKIARQVDFGLWFVYQNDVFCWHRYNVNFFGIQLCREQPEHRKHLQQCMLSIKYHTAMAIITKDSLYAITLQWKY